MVSDLGGGDLEAVRRRDLSGRRKARFSFRPRQEGRWKSKTARATTIGSPGGRGVGAPPRGGCPGAEPPALRQGGGDLLGHEGLDDVADLDVLVAGDADAALEAALDLGGVVLEAAERADLPLVDHAVVAEEAGVGAARDDPVDDHAAGDDADFGIRNVSRTSARPLATSLLTVSRRPAIAFLISSVRS